MRTETLSFEERKRERWLALAGRHLPLVYRFVRHELAYFRVMGELEPGELSAEDVIDAALLRAQHDYVRDPIELNVRGWLIRVACEQMEGEVRRLEKERERAMRHMEEDVFVADPCLKFQIYLEPEFLKLEDMFPDMKMSTPDEETKCQQLWSCISAVLHQLRPEWRRAMTLHYVEGFTVAEVAEAVGRSVPQMQQLLEEARRTLHERVVVAGCRFEQ